MFTNVCDFIPTVQKFRKVEEIVSETFTHAFINFSIMKKTFLAKVTLFIQIYITHLLYIHLPYSKIPTKAEYRDRFPLPIVGIDDIVRFRKELPIRNNNTSPYLSHTSIHCLI